MHEAKTQLSRLVERAAAGEDIVIAEAGKPLVRLVPYEPPNQRRTPGRWAGQVQIAPDFDDRDRGGGLRAAVDQRRARRSRRPPPGRRRDLFDRMLIAQAQVERCAIVTRDPAFDDYEVDVLPC